MATHCAAAERGVLLKRKKESNLMGKTEGLATYLSGRSGGLTIKIGKNTTVGKRFRTSTGCVQCVVLGDLSMHSR